MAITSSVRQYFVGSAAERMTMLATAIGLIGSSSVCAGAQPHMLQATNFIGNPNLLLGFGAPQNDEPSHGSLLFNLW